MKKLITLLLSVMLLLSLALVGCNGKDGDDGGDPSDSEFVFTLNNDEASYSIAVSADYKSAAELTIPESYEGKPVTAVASRGFSGMRNLTELSLPSSITSIKASAFLNSTGLTSITASGVTSIGRAAFSGCKALTSVTVGNISLIPEECFKGCEALTSYVVPASVTEIDKYAFSNCKRLSGVTFNDGLTRIDNYAFENCTAWTSITLPTANPLHLGDYAFSRCGFTSLKIPANVMLGTYTFNQLAWDEDAASSACTAVYFYNEAPTVETLGVNSIGYTWDGANFKVYVPEGTMNTYVQLCETIKTNGDDAWVRCVTSLNKMAEFDVLENPYA